MTDLTQEEVDAQIALSDARMDVAQGNPITPERYALLINRLYRNREQRAKQMASAKKPPSKRAAPMSDDELGALFQ